MAIFTPTLEPGLKTFGIIQLGWYFQNPLYKQQPYAAFLVGLESPL
jgi:hypothetical protein